MGPWLFIVDEEHYDFYLLCISEATWIQIKVEKRDRGIKTALPLIHITVTEI